MTDTEDRNFSKASIQAGVQASMALCATCAHERGGHPEDGACTKQWKGGAEGKTDVFCRCEEYWPERRDREDGMAVSDHAVAVGGSVVLTLDRRITTEFWDQLTQGRGLTVLARFEVAGKSFRLKEVTLKEQRKLVLKNLYFLQEDTLERKQVLDALGREVDPETGEVLDGWE